MFSKRIATLFGILFLIGSVRSVAATATDACSLLTKTRVSTILGAGQHIGAKTSLICGWSQAGSTTPSSKRVLVDILDANGKATPVDRFNTWYRHTALMIKKGSSVIQIRVYGFPMNEIKEKEKTLVQDALSKL